MFLRAIAHWEIGLHGMELVPGLDLRRGQRHRHTMMNTMETGFPMGDGPEEHKDLIVEFIDVVVAIVDITSAQDVVNNVFD